jgi:epoxyqueuosine reductase
MREYKNFIRALALEAGFTRARILSPFEPAAKSLLVCALPYGNRHDDFSPPKEAAYGVIAPFARFNYYREAVKRLKNLSRLTRSRYGGEKCDYRIFCNSRLPEKNLAVASGLGSPGKNGLIISPEAGSLFVIAAMTLPLPLEADPPLAGSPEDFPLCAGCGSKPHCAAACPTGAALGNGLIDREKCIQWYASGHGAANGIPESVLAAWGNRLYGCSDCQDACVHNARPIQGVETSEGRLPAFIDTRRLLDLSDAEIKDMFRGTAMGLSWLGPEAIRRNAEAVMYRRNGFSR